MTHHGNICNIDMECMFIFIVAGTVIMIAILGLRTILKSEESFDL